MGYGEVKITSVKLDKLDFSKSLLLKSFMNSAVTEDAIHLHTLSFRVSFYDVALDRIMAPLTFSERRHIRMSPGDGQDNLSDVSLSWSEQKLPTLRTARNKLSLIR